MAELRSLFYSSFTVVLGQTFDCKDISISIFYVAFSDFRISIHPHSTSLRKGYFQDVHAVNNTWQQLNHAGYTKNFLGGKSNDLLMSIVFPLEMRRLGV